MKKITFALFIIATGVGAYAYYLYQKPVVSLRDADAVAILKSAELFQSFENEFNDATKNYVGKVLEVNGLIVDILNNADSSSSLVLGSDHMMFGVKCRLDPKENNQPLPEKGDNISVKGKCTGMNSDVELNQCIILKP